LKTLLSIIFALGLAISTHSEAQAPPDDAVFVGSAACEDCHQNVYSRWKNTRMANVVVDPNERPDVVLGDFTTEDPLVTFGPEDVALVYGSKWKQRYFTKIGDDYFVYPAQWDVQNENWRRYYVREGTDWWVEHYPADQMQRPTGPLCDGCHSTNYDIETKQVSEWNVGCEKCHGAGAAHVQNPEKNNVINPARLEPVRGIDICIQCHSQGQPQRKPIAGVYYDWPVGYEPGDRLSDYWQLEEHHLGEETFTHWPDGSAHKNRMQGNDYVASAMYQRGVGCWACHDVHGTENAADLIKPGDGLCLTCHGPASPAGPTGTVTQHTQHSVEKTECVDCHMPRIARTISDVNVRSHTFRFISPTETESYGIPNPCSTCHTDFSPERLATELKRWGNASPWRVSH